MRARLPLVLQILGLVMFFTGTIISKNGNLLLSEITTFLLACFTGLKPE